MFCALLLSSTLAAAAPRTPAPDDAVAYIIAPAHGETVGRVFTVKFGLRGMGVAPAGVTKPNTGHHHLLIDGEITRFDQAMGKNVRHFGGGQTEVTLELPPGRHTLQLILGDHRHVPHEPPVMSQKITVFVK